MPPSNQSDLINTRRTLAIISHPDAGKTTITEKMLLFGNAIQIAGAVKAKKNQAKAKSDWMQMEQDRGISVTTAVMQFPYNNCVVNLLDTPGHEDFSEDTYRTLSAVDSVLMVLDGSKGVEKRTIKLMEVCRMRDTPIFTFINKLDKECREGIELLDEIEKVLDIQAAPINWPLGIGKLFKGTYNFYDNKVRVFKSAAGGNMPEDISFSSVDTQKFENLVGSYTQELREEIELMEGIITKFDKNRFLAGKQTPVYFGTALANFGVKEWLDAFVKIAPTPQPRISDQGEITPHDSTFSGFIFKIQANMNARHRDRIAFMRICSGTYHKGMKVRNIRLNKEIKINDAVTFMAGERNQVEKAVAGDIIGLHNHGTIQIGDTFTSGPILKFKGIPNFAPELFRIITLKNPLKMKQLRNGLQQLAEEGSVQVFFPLDRNDIIVGAVGILQFEVVAFRLKDEYKVDASYSSASIYTARWVNAEEMYIQQFKQKMSPYLALDSGGYLTYLAPTRVNLQLAEERHPNLKFSSSREHL